MKCVASQFPMRLIERNDALHSARLIENANLAGAEADACESVVDCLSLIQEHRLNSSCFKKLSTRF